MSDFQAIADRVEIEALRGEFTDASMQHDWDRFASLFIEDGVWGMPHIDVEIVGRERIRSEVERLRGITPVWHPSCQPWRGPKACTFGHGKRSKQGRVSQLANASSTFPLKATGEEGSRG